MGMRLFCWSSGKFCRANGRAVQELRKAGRDPVQRDQRNGTVHVVSDSQSCDLSLPLWSPICFSLHCAVFPGALREAGLSAFW